MRRLRFRIAGLVVGLGIVIMPRGLLRASFEEMIETWAADVACDLHRN